MSMLLPGIIGKEPKLREPLEFLPVERKGERLILVRDPQGFATSSVFVPIPLVPVLARLDGRHSLDQIVREVDARLTRPIIEQFITDLDANGLIDTPQMRTRIDSAVRQFLQGSVRPSVLAGNVYPSDPDELRLVLDEFIDETDSRLAPDQVPAAVEMVMCPHIDYERGWQSYGAAYSALGCAARPDIILLIGTSHSGGSSLFQLSRKDFASPLGVLTNAREAVDRIAERYGEERSFRDELLHRREHSLELQVPFLLHRFGPDAPPIIPVLVGSFHRFLSNKCDPSEDEEVRSFVDAMAELISSLEEKGQRLLIYNGVDLSHMGLYFGDGERVSDAGLPLIESRDRQLLKTILDGDEAAMLEHMAEDCDRRRVCGFPSLYTALAIYRTAGKTVRGSLIDYRQAVDPISDCIVSFASAWWG